jgi:hypothetical protein
MSRDASYVRKGVLAAFLLVGVAAWVAKLFTVKTSYRDDPSVGLVWRSN